MGSPRIITDQSGAIVSRKDFAAYGDEVVTPQRTAGLGYQPTSIREDYTGYQRDEESGLEFAEARYYNPLNGGFKSVDPLNESGNMVHPQTFNRYSYVVNDPLNVVDPSGMIPCSAEYSYGQCGGDDGFLGGGQFGDQVTYDRQTLGDVDLETQEFISRYLEQISNSQARYFIITYEKKPEEDDVVATFLIFLRCIRGKQSSGCESTVL